MKLHLLIEVPSPEKTSKAPCKLTIEEQVRDAIELIESGYESRQEWLLINKVFSALSKKKPNARITNIINMIKPVLSKYGYHGVSK